MSDNSQNSREEIRKLLKNMNSAWSEGRPEELERYFHDGMVVAHPGFRARGVGKRECVESYRQFMSRATVHEYRESEPVVDIWGSTAVASYTFEIDYEMSGKDYHDAGVDLFVFIHESGSWRAVWRTVVPLPELPNG